MKISRETIAGLVAAVELFMKKDYNQQLSIWENMSLHLCKTLENRNDISIRTGYPSTPGIQPACILRVFIKPLTMSASELQEKLENSSTPVYVDMIGDEIIINPQCLEPEEIEYLSEII